MTSAAARSPPGKEHRGNFVIAHGGVPGNSFGLVPAAVNDKIAEAAAAHRPDQLLHPLLGGTAPGGAVFVEYRRQFCRQRRRRFVNQAGGGFVQGTGPGGGKRGSGGGKGFAGGQRFPPLAGLTVRQSARNRQPVILAVYFHLPGGIVPQRTAPEHLRPAVLGHQPGKPAVAGQGPRLTKPQAPHAKPCPGGFQPQGLHRVGAQPALHTPTAEQPVEP